MLLELLVALGLSIDIVCESPLKHADPLKNATLISASLVLRHGMRTPMDRWPYPGESNSWMCDSKDSESPKMHVARSNGFYRRYQRVSPVKRSVFALNCDEGELLTEGMKQHVRLGAFYRSYLVDKMKLIPPYLDKPSLTLRSSRVERTIRSAVSFMNGMYPPATPGEQVTLTTGTSGSEVLYPSNSACKDMRDSWDQWIQTEEYQQRKEKSLKLYAPLYEFLNITDDGTNWMFLGDWMASHVCAKQSLPEVVTDEMIIQGVKDIAYYSYGHYHYKRGVVGSSIWRKILLDIDNFLSLDTQIGPFKLYSAHDTTIMALLTTLGFYSESVPPYRSHFLIELWRDLKNDIIMRVVFNGEPVVIDFMKQKDTYRYTDFKQAISKAGYLGYCLAEYPKK